MNKHSGFSLIELILVIAVIAIIVAIAIPNLLASRRAAKEGSTVSALRTIYGANVSYAATVGAGNYAGTPSSVGTSALSDLANATFIDRVLGAGEKGGYAFVGDCTAATPTTLATFYFAANPTTPSGILATGTKRFGVATDGVIRYDAAPATLATPFDAATLVTATPINNS